MSYYVLKRGPLRSTPATRLDQLNPSRSDTEDGLRGHEPDCADCLQQGTVVLEAPNDKLACNRCGAHWERTEPGDMEQTTLRRARYYS